MLKKNLTCFNCIGYYLAEQQVLKQLCVCAETLYTAERTVASGREWHKLCFACTNCGKILHPGKHSEVLHLH